MKYYYKDALAAAYMCREFGVKYCGYGAINQNQEWVSVPEELEDLSVDELSAALKREYSTHLTRIAIHPDSLPLLDGLPPAKILALKELNLWPLEE